jgi:hypothetical protein
MADDETITEPVAEPEAVAPVDTEGQGTVQDADAGGTGASDPPSEPVASVDTSGGGSGGQENVRAADVIDIDAELSAKEALADKLEAGTITYEDYAKKVAGHDRNIVKGQRQLAKPAQEVQRTYQQQEANRQYWAKWGQGKDVAQIQYGKTVSAKAAQRVLAEVEAEFDANPRYQRPEFQRNRDALIYDKFIDALGVEAKKPKQQQATTTSTRASGSGGAGASPISGGTQKTARERLNDGEYEIGQDAQRLGMI